MSISEVKFQLTTSQSRKAFGEEYLICIPPREKGVRLGWVRSDQCVWKGEPWMVKFHVLSKHYPDLGALFQSSLLIPDAGIQHIVEEAVAVPETVAEMKSVGRIEKILHALTSHLIRNSNDDNINMFNSDSELNPEDKAKLRRARMFPIHPGKRNQHFERLSSAEDKDTWLIADRAIFWTQFRGKVPILALDAGTILRIRPLLVAIGLHDRFLSHVATNITEAHGDVTLLEDVTMEYQRRSKFLFR